VCDHSPLSPDLCKPNKALRTTIRVFLRTEEKKREKVQQAATGAVAADAPVVNSGSGQVKLENGDVDSVALKTEIHYADVNGLKKEEEENASGETKNYDSTVVCTL
jgi:hypothetical protein